MFTCFFVFFFYFWLNLLIVFSYSSLLRSDFIKMWQYFYTFLMFFAFYGRTFLFSFDFKLLLSHPNVVITISKVTYKIRLFCCIMSTKLGVTFLLRQVWYDVIKKLLSARIDFSFNFVTTLSVMVYWKLCLMFCIFG